MFSSNNNTSNYCSLHCLDTTPDFHGKNAYENNVSAELYLYEKYCLKMSMSWLRRE